MDDEFQAIVAPDAEGFHLAQEGEPVVGAFFSRKAPGHHFGVTGVGATLPAQ